MRLSDIVLVRAFVAGASGVLGRRIVKRLVARGHSVVGLVRSDASATALASLGGEARRADLFDKDAVAHAASGCDIVIRAATAIPTKVRTGPADWAMNDRIRREGTRSLVAAATHVGARAFLQESVVWAVGTLDGRPFDEDAPPAGDPILASALDGERIAREAGSARGFETLALRCGGFYSADGWHTRILAESMARGRPVLIGRHQSGRSFTRTTRRARSLPPQRRRGPACGTSSTIDRRRWPISWGRWRDDSAHVRLAACRVGSRGCSWGGTEPGS